MEMKNKLYMHHKSKTSLVLRNFSVAFFGFAFFLSAVTIPTYFSVREEYRIATQALDEDPEENVVDEPSDEVEEEEENLPNE